LDPNPVVLNAVSRIDTILVRFSITETQYLRLRRYDRVERTAEGEDIEELGLDLILADGSKHDYKGRLDFGDRQVDPTTGTLLLQASFPNPERIIRPGQFARVRAVLAILEDGIIIPQRCVSEIQGIYQVFVVNSENEVEIRQVRTGRKKGNMWIIEEGLSAGEKVVLEGIQRARSDMKINPVVQEFEYIDQDNIL
jgi:membrane fusion protein (multidrug efflux system)